MAAPATHDGGPRTDQPPSAVEFDDRLDGAVAVQVDVLAGRDVLERPAGPVGPGHRQRGRRFRAHLDESVLDESVARVLALKFRMGLFEEAGVDEQAAYDTLGADDHQAVAYDAACTSMTLLENDGLLPLSGDEDVFLAGPNADNLVHQVGGWSIDYEEGIAGTTIREALADRLDGDLTYEQGTALNEELDVDAAAEKAADADVAVVAVGEGWYLHEFGAGPTTTETGEWPTRSNMHLSDAQRSLVQAIHETGTPVVGVLVTGRPLIVDWMADNVPALLMAYFPGTQGGPAIADTLLGDNEPRGRLPVSIPRSHGHLPTHHDYRHHPMPIGEHEHPDSYDPLYAFGHGLGYTEFEYRDVSIETDELGPGDDVELEVTLANVGDRDSSEVIQVYGSQETPRRVRPIRELVGFERVELDAGEERTVTLTLAASDFGYYRPDVGHVVEDDTYTAEIEAYEVSFDVDGTYQ